MEALMMEIIPETLVYLMCVEAHLCKQFKEILMTHLFV